jgi:hypothetical protein
MNNEIELRYGCNPDQVPARACSRTERLPFTVLNGSVGYINLLDALNSWQLVHELGSITGDIAAASFKHVSPTGVALGLPLSETLRNACRVEDLELSPVACAYARARGTDRLCSFGDWVAVSDTVDVSLARLLQRESRNVVLATTSRLPRLEVQTRGQAAGPGQCSRSISARWSDCRGTAGVDGSVHRRSASLVARPKVSLGERFPRRGSWFGRLYSFSGFHRSCISSGSVICRAAGRFQPR